MQPFAEIIKKLEQRSSFALFEAVALLQLVQLLGRGESWRVSRIQQSSNSNDNNNNISINNTTASNTTGMTSGRRRGPGNPLSRELAIDIAHRLLHLDRTDLRVRLLIPSLLLEGGYYEEAYGFFF